jgi:hypothetical protein
MDRPRPSSVVAPSIWYAAVDAPHTKRGGKLAGSGPVTGAVTVMVEAAVTVLPSSGVVLSTSVIP